jgi:hypothetical protein
MAYENYSQVSWTDGTPITGDRLQQMSTNIQQVKEATDDSPQGLKKIKSVSTASSSFSNFATYNEIISLKDDTGTGGTDNRVTIGASRYYRVTLNFTGFVIDAKGAEDSVYTVAIYNGLYATIGAASQILTADFTPPIFAYINTASAGGAATISDIALRNNSYDSKFGASTLSIVLSTSLSGLTNQSFFAAVKREQGASASNAPSYYVPASSSVKLLQLYVEDIGGIA